MGNFPCNIIVDAHGKVKRRAYETAGRGWGIGEAICPSDGWNRGLLTLKAGKPDGGKSGRVLRAHGFLRPKPKRPAAAPSNGIECPTEFFICPEFADICADSYEKGTAKLLLELQSVFW